MTEQELKNLFGKNIQKYRKKRNWTQADFSGETGLSINTISEIENGINFVHADTLITLADALHTPVYELFKPEGVKPDNPDDLLYEFKEHAKEALDNLGNEYFRKIKRLKNTRP